MGVACSTCWQGLVLGGDSRRRLHGAAAAASAAAKSAEADMPDAASRAERKEVAFEGGAIVMETWPSYRLGSSLWPSGALLALALAERLPGLPEVAGRSVAELGAGPGLPGLVCAKLLGAAEVSITDRADLVPLIARNIELNGVAPNCRAEALDWDLAYDSPLAARCREAAGRAPLDVVLAADVVYFEEQDPLVEALSALLAPRQTVLVLAYRERTAADRAYVDGVILPKLDYTRLMYGAPAHGECEIYVGRLR
mmetsp:Transcript_56284/g.163181  ORF Transcript_56284/g.163181 Transcript_56284/m.163181 type:complete len:254 (-) Transcript_56284:82-843(-)